MCVGGGLGGAGVVVLLPAAAVQPRQNREMKVWGRVGKEEEEMKERWALFHAESFLC